MESNSFLAFGLPPFFPFRIEASLLASVLIFPICPVKLDAGISFLQCGQMQFIPNKSHNRISNTSYFLSSILYAFIHRKNVCPFLFERTTLIFVTSNFFLSRSSRSRRSMELDFFPLNSIISALVLNPSGRGGHSLFWMCSCRSFCQGFRGDFIRRILCLWVDGTCCLVVLLGIHRAFCRGESFHTPSRVAILIYATGLGCIRESYCRGIRCCTRCEGRWRRYGNNQWRGYGQR